MKFKLENQKTYVEIDQSILNKIQEKYDKNLIEVGGWLFGTYSTDMSTAIIEEAIFLPNVHKKPYTNFEFDKMDKQIWDEKHDLGLRVVGAFHTHPNNSPQPSIIDDDEMMRLASGELNCPEIIQLIMGKNHNTTLYFYTKYDKLQFFPVTSLEESLTQTQMDHQELG